MGVRPVLDDVDEDTLLTVAGVAVVGVVLAGLVVAALAAATAPQRATDIPDAEWSLERVNGTHVRIAHDGGEPVPAEELVVRVDGYERHADWRGVVAEGDAAVVQASRGQLVLLKWTGGSRNVEDELARWQV